MTGLRQKVMRGLGWRGFADVTQMLLHIAFTAVLARLLDIADFGLVVMCLIFVRFVRAFTDVGFGSAIIRSPDVTEGQISTIFYLQILIKLTITALCIVAAPLAAGFFAEPRLVELIRALAWSVVIDGFAFPQTLLRKQMRFGGYSVLEIVSLVAGNAIGVAMAATGYGVWSLVARTLSQKAVFSTGVWFVAGWRPRRPAFAGTGQLIRFGVTMFGSNVVYFFSQNMASITIGKFIGAEPLGLFNVAYNLAVVPAQKIQAVLTTVLTPAFAALQARINELRRQVYAGLFSLGAMFIPAMAGLSAVAPDLVVVLYGDKWRAAGEILRLLAFVGLSKGLEHYCRSILVVRGHAVTIFRITLAETMVSLPLLAIGAWFFGVTGITWAYLAASVLALFLTVRASQNSMDDRTVFLRATIRSFAAAAAMFGAVLLWPLFVPSEPPAALLAQVVLGVIIYLAVRLVLLDDRERRIVGRWPIAGRLFQRG